MMQQGFENSLDPSVAAAIFGPFFFLFLILIPVVIFLKAWSLWRAARMSKTGWFIALMILNTMGILPVIFLLMTKDEYNKKHRLK